MISILFLGAVISVIFMVLFVILGSAFLSNSTLNKLLSKKIIIISSICIIIISMILSFKIFTNMIWYNYDSRTIYRLGVSLALHFLLFLCYNIGARGSDSVFQKGR